MNIAIMSHTKKQDLMVQFCTAYCGVLSKHSVCGTNATGRMVAEATGLPVNLFLSHEHGGIEQIGQRIIYNEIDMVLFFNSPSLLSYSPHRSIVAWSFSGLPTNRALTSGSRSYLVQPRREPSICRIFS